MEVEPQTSPPVHLFLPAALVLMGVGWGGMVYLLQNTTPNGGTRWLMFFCLALALTGSALPITAYLNRRFSGRSPATTWIVLRQAMWFGIYFPTLAWLQIGRVLTGPIAFLLAAGFILMEWLLRMRERSQWKPVLFQ